MIFALMLAALSMAQADDAAQRDAAYCSSGASDQPGRLCLADRRYERGKRELAALLPLARRAAEDNRREIDDFSKRIGGVTLEGDPIAALIKAQKIWEASHAADCGLIGLQSATGNGGTEGPTAELECLADRVAQRVRFLKDAYSLGE